MKYSTILLTVITLSLQFIGCAASGLNNQKNAYREQIIQKDNKIPVGKYRLYKADNQNTFTDGQWQQYRRQGTWVTSIEEQDFSFLKTYSNDTLNGPFAIWNGDSSIIVNGTYREGELSQPFYLIINGEVDEIDVSDTTLIYKEFGTGFLRPKKHIMQLVRMFSPALRFTYNRYLLKKPGFSGVVIIKMWIKSDGRLSHVEVSKSTTGYPEFDQAIANDVKNWNFRPGAVGNCVITMPFTFSE